MAERKQITTFTERRAMPCSLAVLTLLCLFVAGCGLPTLSQTPTPAGIPVILKPTPTEVPPPGFVTGFNVAAYATQPMPYRYGTVDIVGKFTHNVVGVPNATMYVLVHWNAQDGSQNERIDADRPTDLDGISVVHIHLNGNAPVDTPVIVDVFFTYGGKIYPPDPIKNPAQTFFTPN